MTVAWEGRGAGGIYGVLTAGMVRGGARVPGCPDQGWLVGGGYSVASDRASSIGIG